MNSSMNSALLPENADFSFIISTSFCIGLGSSVSGFSALSEMKLHVQVCMVKGKVSEIAFLKRRNIDKYGLEWSEAVKQAINDYAGENWNGMG